MKATSTKILHILANGFGALLIFALLGVYYKIQRRSEEDSRQIDLYGFVASKKAISLLLLFSFVCMGGYSLYQTALGHRTPGFFPRFLHPVNPHRYSHRSGFTVFSSLIQDDFS